MKDERQQRHDLRQTLTRVNDLICNDKELLLKHTVSALSTALLCYIGETCISMNSLLMIQIISFSNKVEGACDS